jgi:tetratricopeptide (TPR) repeat protein
LRWAPTLVELDEAALQPGQTIRSPRALDSGFVDAIQTVALQAGAQPAPRVGTEASSGYRLLGELGRGGMGVVYRARQQSLRRDVAVKSLLPAAAGSKGQAMFVSEAWVSGSLDHPNIVPVHELARLPGGELIMSMKLVGGTPWSELIQRPSPERKTTLEQHLEILLAVCNAIAFAHSRGVLHRDLKPENVMVGEFGEVLVMDWGLAACFGPEPEPFEQVAPHVSRLSSPSGTPSYMSPEQADGEPNGLGPWTDVYLLGAILCELLTGSPPHQGDSVVEVLVAACRNQPPTFGPEVSEELAQICLRALQTEPEARHASVLAFQEELRLHLEHRQSAVISERAQRDLDRCREEVSASDSASLYEAYAQVVAGFRQAQTLWAENQAAIQGEQEARQELIQAALGREDLGYARSQLAQLPPDQAGALAAELEQAEAQLRLRARSQRVLKVAFGAVVLVCLAVSLLYARQKERERARLAEKDALLRKQVQAGERFVDWVGKAHAAQLRTLGRTELLAELNQQAQLYRDAMRAGSMAFSEEVRLDLQRLDNASRTLEGRGDYPGAAAKQREIVALMREAAAQDGAPAEKYEGDALAAEVELARLQNLLGEYAQARAVLETALPALDDLGSTNPGDAFYSMLRVSGRRYLSEALAELGDPSAALAQAREALPIAAAEYARSSSDELWQQALGSVHQSIGDRLRETGDQEGARSSYLRQLEHYESLLRADPGHTGWQRELALVHGRLGHVFREAKAYREALGHDEQAVASWRALTAGNPENVDWQHELAIAVINLGISHLKCKDRSQALDCYREGLGLLRRLIREHPGTPTWLEEEATVAGWIESLEGRGR